MRPLVWLGVSPACSVLLSPLPSLPSSWRSQTSPKVFMCQEEFHGSALLPPMPDSTVLTVLTHCPGLGSFSSQGLVLATRLTAAHPSTESTSQRAFKVGGQTSLGHCCSYNCDVTTNVSPQRVGGSYNSSSHTQVPREQPRLTDHLVLPLENDVVFLEKSEYLGCPEPNGLMSSKML